MNLSLTKRIKIIHVVEDLHIGGLERVLAAIVSGIDKNAYDVEVWCLEEGGQIADELHASNIAVRVLRIANYHNPINIIRLALLIRNAHAALVHTHGYFASTFGRLAAIIAGTSHMVSHVHTTDFGLGPKHQWVERILSKFTDRIVCISEAVKKFVVNSEHIDPKRTCIIYNGVGEQNMGEAGRETLGFRPEDIIVATVASLTAHKGHRVLLDAMSQIAHLHKDLNLLLVGDGPLRPELEEYAAALGLSANVHFLGRRNDVMRLLREVDIFVLASTQREGFGLSIVEAMASSLPVIGTRIGGIPEVIEHNVNGFLVEPNDSNALANAVESLICDKELRTKMGRKGRVRYEEHFRLDTMISRVEHLYREVLGLAS